MKYKSYLNYLKEEDRAHCLLYPNVGGEFPFQIKSRDVHHICRVRDLKQHPFIEMRPEIYREIADRFHSDDLCFWGTDFNVLVSFWQNETTSSSQELNLAQWMDHHHLEALPEKLESGTILLRELLEFDFDESSSHVFWNQIHLHMLQGSLKEPYPKIEQPIEHCFVVNHHYIPLEEYQFESRFEWHIVANNQKICSLPFSIKEFSEFQIGSLKWYN